MHISLSMAKWTAHLNYVSFGNVIKGWSSGASFKLHGACIEQFMIVFSSGLIEKRMREFFSDFRLSCFRCVRQFCLFLALGTRKSSPGWASLHFGDRRAPEDYFKAVWWPLFWHGKSVWDNCFLRQLFGTDHIYYFVGSNLKTLATATSWERARLRTIL